jgi:hypothetical protein
MSRKKEKSFNSVSKNMTTFLKSKTFLEQEDHSHYNKRLFKSCRDLLVNINKAGLITENSQLGSLEPGSEEYAYICGFIKKEDTTKFLNFINTQCDNKIGFIIEYPLVDEPFKIVVTYDEGEPFSILTNNLTKSELDSLFKNNNISAEVADYICLIDKEMGRLANKKDGLFTDALNGLKQLNSKNRSRRRYWFKLW